jgi:hypothetical protein
MDLKQILRTGIEYQRSMAEDIQDPAVIGLRSNKLNKRTEHLDRGFSNVQIPQVFNQKDNSIRKILEKNL